MKQFCYEVLEHDTTLNDGIYMKPCIDILFEIHQQHPCQFVCLSDVHMNKKKICSTYTVMYLCFWYFVMHVINTFTQNNLIFLSHFSKKVKHRKCCLTCRRIWLFLLPLADLIGNTVRCALFDVCYPWLLKEYASIAILSCYHNPKVDGDKWYSICFSCLAQGR